MQVASELVGKFASLDNLSRATVPDLCRVKGIGRDKAVTLVAAFTLARRMAQESRQELPLLDTPEAVALIRLRITSPEATSSPENGSSSKMRSGLCMSAAAMRIFCRMPFE